MTNATLDMAQKLDLHRLAAHAVLAHTSVMPVAGQAPVLAVVEQQGRAIAIAAPDKADAIGGPGWGLGASMALVQGPAPTPVGLQEFDSRRLVSQSVGNARLIRLADRIDGPVATFGRAFWRIIADESPLTVAAMKTHGVRSADYTDRYLVTPLNLRLLFEVLSEMPGREHSQVSVATGRLDRFERPGWAVFHSFPEDGQRRQVLQALLPKASIEIRTRGEVPHARSLSLTLGDGRCVVLLLDQGFGAWRSEPAARHDFSAAPAVQARLLRGAIFTVRAESLGEVPIILEEGPAGT